MKNTLETRLGVFVALVLIAGILILETVAGPEIFIGGRHYRAQFKNVQDLKVGDRVKMAGYEIGRVEKMQLDGANSKVMVFLKLKKGVQVRTDSLVSIKFVGLMGQNYVAVNFGSPAAPEAVENALLNSEETPDLSAIITKIDSVATGVENLTKTFTGDKIDNLMGPLIAFIKDNRAPLTATIAHIQDISGQISSHQGTVGKLIYDDTLYNTALLTVSNLQDTAAEIKTTVADARGVIDKAHVTMDQVNSGQGTVGKLLKDETLYHEITTSATQLKEILQKINQGQGSVGKLVNDRELYNNAKLTLQKLDKATEGLEDQGPLSVMGILINNLF
jgi:phospholipid/cholesterol/gamma-HCH transport system substrate-binding protein